MTAHVPQPELDRIAYQPGQTLSADDLLSGAHRTRDLLRLHTAFGHGVWGVATGMTCLAEPAGVRVLAGVAFDRAGRTLRLADDTLVGYPVVPQAAITPAWWCFDLVARWAPDSELRGDRPVADAGGNLTDRPALRWEFAGSAAAARAGDDAYRPGADLPFGSRVRYGLDVPLVRLSLPASSQPTDPATGQTVTLDPLLDPGRRPLAHGLVRPRIVYGTVPAGRADVTGRVVDWSLSVDTSSAGFAASAAPAYFVSLGAHPFGDAANLGDRGSQDTAAGAPSDGPDLATRLSTGIGPFVSIEESSSTGFVLHVRTYAPADWGTWASSGALPGAVTDGGTITVNPVSIDWVGVDTPTRPFWLPASVLSLYRMPFLSRPKVDP